MVKHAIAAFQHAFVQRIAHHAMRSGIVPVEAALIAKPRKEDHLVGLVHRVLNIRVWLVVRNPDGHPPDRRTARQQFAMHQIGCGVVIPAMFRVFADKKNSQAPHIAKAVVDQVRGAAALPPAHLRPLAPFSGGLPVVIERFLMAVLITH